MHARGPVQYRLKDRKRRSRAWSPIDLFLKERGNNELQGLCFMKYFQISITYIDRKLRFTEEAL